MSNETDTNNTQNAETTQTQPAEQPQMKKASELDIGWLKGSGVSGLSGPFEEEKLEPLKVDSTKALEFAWFAVKAKNGNTDQEEREKIEAMKRQVEMGIIKPNGMPVGWKEKPEDMKHAQGADRDKPVPPQQQQKPKLPGGKLGRKLLRERDRAITKDMNRQIKEEQRKLKDSMNSSLNLGPNVPIKTNMNGR
jgi:hypothetical protein